MASRGTAQVDEVPLRDELYSVSQLEQHARGLAAWHLTGRATRGAKDGLLQRLTDNERILRDAHGMVTQAVRNGRRITPAAEWFVDNYHLIEEQIRTARRHLPRGYHRELPRLMSGPSAGTPRVYELVQELISHSHGRLDIEGLRAYVAAYQAQAPLQLGELWAIPIMLRLALLDSLRRVVRGVTVGRRDREMACEWVERMVETAAVAPGHVVLVLAEMVETNPPLSNAFVSELATRLQGLGPAFTFPITWLEQRLAERGQTVAQVFQWVSQSQAADQVAIGNCIGSLRLLGATTWRDFVEAMSSVEQSLRQDPAGAYERMDFGTRDQYRHAVEAIAKRSPASETAVADAAVALAGAGVERRSHVGFYLVDAGRSELEARVGMRRPITLVMRRWSRRVRLALYVAAVLSLSVAMAAWLLHSPLAQAYSGIPSFLIALVLGGVASQLAVACVNLSVMLLVAPRTLPRLDFSKGIPATSRTAVVVPTMLTERAEVAAQLELLEVRYLANRDVELAFVVLTDFRDAASECMPGDDALLAQMREGIAALNARYAREGATQPFALYHRARRYCVQQGVFMGWERKRGKLEEFSRALRGEAARFHTIEGDQAFLSGVRFVIVLDSDTELPRDTARELAAALAHPLNRPRIDPQCGRVVEGYGILQPRVMANLESAGRSAFAQLFAGEFGIDPYTRAVSDVYQDAFDEGSFVGKGIYDVDALCAVTVGRLPEGRILSHDLLEGGYARAGLVSDVLLVEDYPATYLADASRRSRWIRGDVQIAAWLLPRVPGPLGKGRVRNPLSWLSRWKIFDNLRRSVMPLAQVALLLVGWNVPGAASYATLSMLAILILPGLLDAVTALLRRPQELSFGLYARDVVQAWLRALARDAVSLAALPYEAMLSAMALGTALYRLHVSGKNLLAWRTSRDAQIGEGNGLWQRYGELAVAPLAGLGCGAWLYVSEPAALPAAAPVLLAWLLLPSVVYALSEDKSGETSGLSRADEQFLRRIARRTFEFFERFVGEGEHFLPPDNFQLDPPCGVAHRTSPTNIGLAFTSHLAANDFGYISAGKLLARSQAMLLSVEKLARYRGHLYNWYDTQNCEPLKPLYVSAVDSGNFVGHLLTFSEGLRELEGALVFNPATFQGLNDLLGVVGEAAGAFRAADAVLARALVLCESMPKGMTAAAQLLAQLEDCALELTHACAEAPGSELRNWAAAFESQVADAQRDLRHMAPWLSCAMPVALPNRIALPDLDAVPTLGSLALMESALAPAILSLREQPDADLSAWALRLQEDVALGAGRARARLSEISDLARRVDALTTCDYDFLYDKERRLLAIGFHVGDHRLDQGYYDLLASEARLASFLAIAQGALPQEHWFSLGRSLTRTGKRSALLSWSGSMFEYLMPMLIMPSYRGTILDETCRAVVDRQIEYGRELGVPWGVSESGYSKTDIQLNYQYRAFGVPGLGFKRGLAEDLVIAPYASVMALMVSPRQACENLRRLVRDGRLGALGFYEAVDYTPLRIPRGKDSVTVASYMAHHQGMSLLSLAHVLLGQPMQRRFEENQEFRATLLLLQERVPRLPVIFPHPADMESVRDAGQNPEPNVRVFSTPNTPAPQVQLLSNGTYHVMVTNAGGGYSRFGELAVTRWQEDSTCDPWGSFCYLRDLGCGAIWSAAHQPTLAPATTYEAIFSQGRAEFRRRDGDIDTHVEISVSPEDDVELRRVSVTNFGQRMRAIELTSYAEVVLTSHAADLAHPAFSNLFVQTEILRDAGAILCTRRPRSSTENPPYLFHLMTVQGVTCGPTSFDSARETFLGRGRTPMDPQAMHRSELSGSEGPVLDPIVAIRNAVTLGPDEVARVHIVTGVAATRELALALIDKYRDRHAAERVFELAWTHSQVDLRRLEATEADTQLYERLASHLLYANPGLRAPRSVIAHNQRDQSGLWAYAISGDLPIMLIRIADRQHISTVRQLLQAHAYFRLKGLKADLVIWNEDPSGYRQVLQEDILGATAAVGASDLVDRPGGIFIRRADQVSEEDKVLMQTVARLIVVGRDGTLAEQLNRPQVGELPPAVFEPLLRRSPRSISNVERAQQVASHAWSKDELIAWNGHGGFAPGGREYVIVTGADAPTPAPWVNVLANPYFGSVVSESGSAYTWCENARNYRLTPWHNDPVSDLSGELFYLRDEHDGKVWSPSPWPAGDREPYTTRHGFGYTTFEHVRDGIESDLCTFVARDAPVKMLLLTLRNRSGRSRRISATAVFSLVLGESRAHAMPYTVTEVDPSSRALLARNSYATGYARRVAFLDCSSEQRSYSGDRAEVLGRNGNVRKPACMGLASLSGHVGAALDPCLAMQVALDLADGQERQLAFSFGSGMDGDDARVLIQRFHGVLPVRAELGSVIAQWCETLQMVQVETPEPAFDFLANGWLLYQVISARMWARSGFYQSGGAYGFRDQLQDAMSLLHAAPKLLREHLVRASSRQFRDGDVQHWWHPPVGWGVRTRISDDFLWLPYAVARYVEATGDVGVLDERTHFIDGRTVRPDEDSYFDRPLVLDELGTVYEHCVRAIKHGLPVGQHGLPLIGSGDWNDGMNLVGEGGKGESVWLAFFLHDVLVRFAGIARVRGDVEMVSCCQTAAAQLAAAVERNGWDGAWYRRAYFDSGEPLGSSDNEECQIDSLPQSWSVLSGVGDPERALRALTSLDERLVRRDLGLIQLFDPAFDGSAMNPGYVKGYVPGVRENGAQYTHAAVWVVMAFAAAGDVERAWELFGLLNPIHHGDSESAIATYKVEPYVVAADVYTNPQHPGRGGWSWYTGAAGWMYRLALESLLGITLAVDHLRVEPLLPRGWGGFVVNYRYRTSLYRIRVHGPVEGGIGCARMRVDALDCPDMRLPLRDDGQTHQAEVWVAPRRAALPRTAA
jgi:cellobiose phosphorylase